MCCDSVLHVAAHYQHIRDLEISTFNMLAFKRSTLKRLMLFAEKWKNDICKHTHALYKDVDETFIRLKARSLRKVVFKNDLPWVFPMKEILHGIRFSFNIIINISAWDWIYYFLLSISIFCFVVIILFNKICITKVSKKIEMKTLQKV